jgi:hypothetical protein
MARAMGGAERTVRRTSAPPAFRAAGAAGKCLVGQQPSEPGGALDARGAHWASTIKFPRSTLLKARRSNQGPMEVGARPRSILDQTIGGRSTDLFFYWFNTIGERSYSSLPRQQKLSTDPPRAGRTFSVCLSRGGNRTTGKDPADLPRARGRALFKREWGVSRKASVSVLGWGLSGSSRSYS